MKIIKRQTNVREHNRQNKHVEANVRNHTRRLKSKQIIGTVRLNQMNYKQAKKKYPFLEPNGDIDGDGVVNRQDCKPFNKKLQDDWSWAEEGRIKEEERVRKEQEDLDEAISNLLARQREIGK